MHDTRLKTSMCRFCFGCDQKYLKSEKNVKQKAEEIRQAHRTGGMTYSRVRRPDAKPL